MCFGALFGTSHKKRKSSSSSSTEKKKKKTRRERPPAEPLRGHGAVVAEVQEDRVWTEKPRARRSKESPRREREEPRPRQRYQYHQDAYKSRPQHQPPLQVQVPSMWYRSVDPESTNSSEEMLLNPRPHRSPHNRQRHSKHTSQSTLRGYGAPRRKSKKDMRPQNSGWSFFAPTTPPKTPKRRDHYQTLDSSPRSHRSPRQHRSTQHHQESPESSRSQQRQHRSRQQQSQPNRHGTHRHAHAQAPPNTAVRRDPDRRFAVLAATNSALEELRREAFAQPSPPPRRERLRRYQGVTIPASSIPYSWDCVSSSQASAGYGEPSTRHRRRR